MFEDSLDETIGVLENMGFTINDPWDIVDSFEKMVAEYAGSKYAVSVDNCTDGIFLCLLSAMFRCLRLFCMLDVTWNLKI